MKAKLKYPDWNNPTDMLISWDGVSKHPVWSEYSCLSGDTLSLRVTVEIAGGFPLFGVHENKEAAELLRIEKDRREAWKNAIQFAEQLWRSLANRQYVVAFRSGNGEHEAVYIYRRIQGADDLLKTVLVGQK